MSSSMTIVSICRLQMGRSNFVVEMLTCNFLACFVLKKII
jgi:hypothetical protein